MRRYVNGFTMIELMVTLVVVAVLAALALPAFKGVFERSRASTEVNDLAKALNYGRLEAINRSQAVEVVPADGQATGWANGISIQQSSDGTVLRTIPAMSAGAQVMEENDIDSIEFNSFGGLSSPDKAVAFTYARGGQSRVVAVCLSGRIQVGAGCN
ncbi:GspH/FimT family pseudopilin [Pseudomonas sp. CAU 1711]|uniref:GspH/FimT family pseudopilin n=1 Tax=Pseudomonas sp. CAU 1711 TaxID=3140356 RepID=UPI003261D207